MDATKPIKIFETRIHEDWIDYNGHMTEARYLHLMSEGSDEFLRRIGMDMDYVATGFSYYSVETHILNKAEIREGEPVAVEFQLLDWSEKKLHIFQRILHGKTGMELASGEQILLHVDMKQNKAVPASAHIIKLLKPIADAQLKLPWPETAGRVGKPRN
ncbi:MAG: thioesterase family protein [Rhizobiaceae bacterium]|nr:thioesterase family protein [Rhizobiaceae bacterium]